MEHEIIRMFDANGDEVYHVAPKVHGFTDLTAFQGVVTVYSMANASLMKQMLDGEDEIEYEEAQA